MIKTDVRVKIKYSLADIKEEIMARLPISHGELSEVRILRRALRLVSGEPAAYDMTVAISLSAEREAGLLKMRKKVAEAPDLTFLRIPSELKHRPVVVGAGPAGLFAALTLAESGARPILIERGAPVEERTLDVSRFFGGGELSPESNIQFGEGGAGAFSDGKLKYGKIDKYKYKVLSELVNAGAPEEITYTVGAHLGTDKLTEIVRRLREKIISLGGEVIFHARLVDITVRDGEIVGATYEKGGERVTLDTKTLVLAIGHSARDTFEMLLSRGVVMERRGFGIGVRIEHPREYIDNLIYKEHRYELGMGASYHLVTHLPSGRSVYSFCMCPGGTVVAAASEPGGVVTNGMSEYARDGENSNAALLVSVTPSDFPGDSPLAGFELQRSIEHRAYSIGGFLAPTQRLEAFMCGDAGGEPTLKPTYPIGTVTAPVDGYLPGELADSLRSGIADFGEWLSGYYYPDATLTGAETRSTSPVRLTRGEKMTALGILGLYPIGEGAGYAGGIISSATDGVLCAENILLSKGK